MTSPIHLLQGITHLDIVNIENKLKIPKESLISQSFFIDLSQVRFAELSAIVQLTLIIEHLIKKNSQIFIALPTIYLTKGEESSQRYSDETKKGIKRQRTRVVNFLKTVGFLEVLYEISTYHKNEIFFTETYNFESQFNFESFQESFSVIHETKKLDYLDYKSIFPLVWIDCKEGNKSFEKIEALIDKILGNPIKGLDSLDIQGIKNVIVSELIKNVDEHSESKNALLAIGLIDSQSLLKKNQYKKDNPIEKKYLDWIEENRIKSQVEIYFGDSGVGMFTQEFKEKYYNENGEKVSEYPRNISKKLNEQKDDFSENMLKWSFDKWSTKKHNEFRRGTKGLYRIQRIVNKYNGIFHITTSTFNGGFRKGGLVEEEWVYEKRKFDFKGTFIQIKLCPFSEAKEFRFTLNDNQKKKSWKVINYNPKTIEDNSILKSFKSEIRKNENLLVILNLKNIKDLEAQVYLEKILPEFSFDSHPCGVVVYLLSNLNNITYQIIVDSSNESILQKSSREVFQESVSRDSEEVYDPILIIGDKNEAFWYGGNQDLINILNESYIKVDKNLKIEELNSFKKLSNETQVRIRLHLENDNKLVVYKNNQFFFNFSYLSETLEESVRNQIGESLLTHGQNYCSPKLEIVENWIDLNKLIKNNEYGFAFTLYLKYKTLINQDFFKYKNQINNNDVYILTDHIQQKELVRAFAMLLGVKNSHIKVASEDVNPNIPKRTKLFPENSNVIVITSIISSSETVRRLVKYVKRDSANPIVVLCLCNSRKYDINKLTTWEEHTDIISIYQKYKTEFEKNDKEFEYFENKYNLLRSSSLKFKSPNFDDEKVIGELEFEIDNQLKESIINEKAFYFHHIGIYRDRHFTFYLDKEKLLRNHNIIWERLETLIVRWQNINKIKYKNFTIYIPQNLVGKNNSLHDFLNSLCKNVIIIDNNNIIKINDANVIYIDFGAISGNSINNIVKKCTDVSNLLICILFDQTKNNDLDFYKKIKTLKNETLWHNPISTNFEVECLYKLPLGYFNSENCPICEHIKTIDTYKLNQTYMMKFSEDRQERLKLIESEEINNSESPFDFYYTNEEPTNEIATELVVKMFEFKTLLEKAETSTQYRVEVYKYIFEVYKNYEKKIREINSNLYALLYYLSNEINWLQKEPLVLRDIRLLLTDIAYKVATINLIDFMDILDSIKFVENTTPEKLAVRYKYAAISLLRSANKLRFCESLSNILKSSYNRTYLSNNLAQNTFYHVNSLFYNKYNRSKYYFEAIEKQLKEFELLKLTLSIEQKVTIEKIQNLNSFALKSLDIASIKSDRELIKLLKKEKEVHYDSNHHPQPENALGNINLKNFSSFGLEDIEIKKEDSTFYNIFRIRVSEIKTNWRVVSYFIESTILPYISKFSDDILKSYTYHSTYYLDEILTLIEQKSQRSILEEFSTLVNRIDIEPLHYFSVRNRYDHLQQLLFNKIIKQDSQFFEFLAQFPTDLEEIINTNIIPHFPQHKLTIQVSSTFVFYPKVKLLEDISLIIHNIHKRLNDDKKTGKYDEKIYEKVKIHTVIYESNTNIEMLIRYDSTDKKNEQNPRQGGLYDIQSELRKFGGDLIFDTNTDSQGLFNLTFKFQKYE